MINTNFYSVPMYTTREFRNLGLFKANQIYNFLFTPSDNALYRSGAVKKFPDSMYKFTTNKATIINGKEYQQNSQVESSLFDEKTLDILVKTGVIICELKEEYAKLDTEDLFKQVKINEVIGLTFKKASEILGIDFEIVKEKFDIKKGATNKKVKAEDIDTFKELIN